MEARRALGVQHPPPWFGDDAELNADMWATADESRDDIARELIDGATRMREDNDSMAPGDQTWWENYRNRLEWVAREASRLSPPDGSDR